MYWVYQPQDKQRSVREDLTKASTEPWPVTVYAVIAHCLSTLHNKIREVFTNKRHKEKYRMQHIY